MILGTSILWFGGFGFNGGSAPATDGVAVQAIINSNLAAAAAARSWMFVEWHIKGEPSETGFTIGAVVGLVATTPAAGYVTATASITIELVGGGVSFTSSNWKYLRSRLAVL